MILMDVNILVYAHREETTDHPASRDWVEDTINSGGASGVSQLVLRGFLRVVTPPQMFARPTPLAVALEVVKQIRDQPQTVPIRPGPRPWAMFETLLRSSDATGNLVPAAYHAALAIESGCDWLTTDKGLLCITCYRLLGQVWLFQESLTDIKNKTILGITMHEGMPRTCLHGDGPPLDGPLGQGYARAWAASLS
jgi:toxin-antitoxin system PIN domain toxin